MHDFGKHVNDVLSIHQAAQHNAYGHTKKAPPCRVLSLRAVKHANCRAVKHAKQRAGQHAMQAD